MTRGLTSVLVLVIGIALVVVVGSASAVPEPGLQLSPQYSDGRFVNEVPVSVMAGDSRWEGIRSAMFDKDPRSVPESGRVPVVALGNSHYLAMADDELSFVRLGHSSVLLQMAGKRILLDPVFSDRVSPVQWAGPKRFHPLPMDPGALPQIDAVLISHNHYDHLDEATVKLIHPKVAGFYVPLGIGRTLAKWGVPAEKIFELDWWQSEHVGELEIAATPAQHFSGRYILDNNQSLWASWVIKGEVSSVYYSGDTGYFDGFKRIAERYGPFDIAFMECGAYSPYWRDIHMLPEDTLQAFKDVNAKLLVPVHNSTFDLSTHAWFDPMEQISALAEAEGISVLIPKVGELVNTHASLPTEAWWRADAAASTVVSIPVATAVAASENH